MTTDELKKEAEEYTETKGKEHFRKFYNSDKNIAELITQVYLDCAEPREKRIAELEKSNTSLLSSVENLNKSVQELEKEKCELLGIIQGKDKAIAELQKDKDYFSDNLDKQIEATLNLQKENGKLEGLLEDERMEYIELENFKNNEIAELEKENAELKLKLEALDGETPWKDIKDKSEVIGQLTKAKEIITVFLKYSEYDEFEQKEFDEYFDNKNKAEQFLKESEVEK